MMGYQAKDHTLETFTMSAENPEFHKRVEVFVDVFNSLFVVHVSGFNYFSLAFTKFLTAHPASRSSSHNSNSFSRKSIAGSTVSS